MKHRAGIGSTTPQILPGQPGYRKLLLSFPPGEEREKFRAESEAALRAQQNPGGQKPPPSQSGPAGGPQ